MVNWTELKINTEFDDTVISSKVKLSRNLFIFKFPKYISKEEADDVSKILIDAVNKLEINEELIVNSVKEIRNLDSRVLVEKNIISSELLKNKDISYYITNKYNSVNLMVNEEDHLNLQVLYPGLMLFESYKLAEKIDYELEKNLSFAYNTNFGYLTSSPTNVGTGMKASAILHLPGLKYSGVLDNTKDALKKLGIEVSGVYGEGSEVLGDIYEISNKKTLGFSEMEIIDKLENIIINIINRERISREDLLKEKSFFLKDKVYRALGILKYARIIDDKESLNNLSIVRMGVYLNLYNKLNYDQITDLMINVQKYNILKYKDSIKSMKDENILRADFIRDFFEREEILNE